MMENNYEEHWENAKTQVRLMNIYLSKNYIIYMDDGMELQGLFKIEGDVIAFHDKEDKTASFDFYSKVELYEGFYSGTIEDYNNQFKKWEIEPPRKVVNLHTFLGRGEIK